MSEDKLLSGSRFPESMLELGFWNHAGPSCLFEPDLYEPFKALKFSPDYLAHVRERYREEGLADMLLLHFYRAGQQLYDEHFDRPSDTFGMGLGSPVIKSPLSPRLPAFLEDIACARRRLPPGIRQLLNTTQVHVGRRREDFDPEGAAKEGRGYEGRTVAYSPASHSPDLITLVQEHRNTYLEGLYTLSTQPAYYYLHECGHGLNSSWPAGLGLFSDEDFFAKAYALDVANLKRLPPGDKNEVTYREARFTNADTGELVTALVDVYNEATSFGRRKNIKYFLPQEERGTQPSLEAARDEAFADLLAAKLMGVEYPLSGSVARTFSRCAAVMDKLLAAVEYEMAHDPDLDAMFIKPDRRAGRMKDADSRLSL